MKDFSFPDTIIERSQTWPFSDDSWNIIFHAFSDRINNRDNLNKISEVVNSPITHLEEELLNRVDSPPYYTLRRVRIPLYIERKDIVFYLYIDCKMNTDEYLVVDLGYREIDVSLAS